MHMIPKIQQKLTLSDPDLSQIGVSQHDVCPVPQVEPFVTNWWVAPVVWSGQERWYEGLSRPIVEVFHRAHLESRIGNSIFNKAHILKPNLLLKLHNKYIEWEKNVLPVELCSLH